MSNFLNFAGNSGVTFKTFTAGTSGGDYPTATTYVLDKSASTNSVLVSVGGVLQKPGTDYTVSGTTLTTTSTITSGIVIDTYIIHDAGNAPVIEDNSIVTAKIADNQVTTAKIAMGSDAAGDILYYNGTDYVRLAKGSALQQLRINSGATAPEWATVTASNDYEFVSSATQDGGSAHIEFTNMADGYDYIYVIIDVQCTTLYADFEALLGTDSSTYRTSNYVGQSFHSSHSSGQTSFEETDSITLVNDAAEGMGTASDTGVKCGEVTLYNPANASDQTAWKHDCTHLGGTPQIKHEYGGGYYSTAEAHTCVKFRCFQGGSARTTTGSILQYRRKRS